MELNVLYVRVMNLRFSLAECLEDFQGCGLGIFRYGSFSDDLANLFQGSMGMRMRAMFVLIL